MKIKLSIVEGSREQQAFSNPVVTWKFKISTGPRCKGLVSFCDYKSVNSAYNAGLRMAQKLDPSFCE